jgi:hypothetical protein
VEALEVLHDGSGGGETRRLAVRIVDRWRGQGFDTLLRHPSGYCAPANSQALAPTLPAGYHSLPMASSEATEALESSLAAGFVYHG